MKPEHANKCFEFSRLVAELILLMYARGFTVVLGDAFRDARVTYGHPKSCHRAALAIDLNLCRNGKYLPDTESHRQFGEWWEASHPLARWGGRFKDGNHYSFEHEGVK